MLDVEVAVAIEVPQISLVARVTPVSPSPDQAAAEETTATAEVPQIEVLHIPLAVEAKSPTTQLSDQAPLDTALSDYKGDEEEGEKKEVEDEDEEKRRGGGREEEEKKEHMEEDEKDADGDDDDDDDDDEHDRKAKVPPKSEPDDQEGLMPEYMIAESIPDLITMDG